MKTKLFLYRLNLNQIPFFTNSSWFSSNSETKFRITRKLWRNVYSVIHTMFVKHVSIFNHTLLCYQLRSDLWEEAFIRYKYNRRQTSKVTDEVFIYSLKNYNDMFSVYCQWIVYYGMIMGVILIKIAEWEILNYTEILFSYNHHFSKILRYYTYTSYIVNAVVSFSRELQKWQTYI